MNPALRAAARTASAAATRRMVDDGEVAADAAGWPTDEMARVQKAREERKAAEKAAAAPVAAVHPGTALARHKAAQRALEAV